MLNQHTLSRIHPYAVGLDRLLGAMAENVNSNTGNYPPFDLIKVDDENYKITLALAGFKPDDVQITHHADKLIVTGQKPETDARNESTFLHRGISTRSFRRVFALAEHAEPQSAEFQNGLLSIALVRKIPEEEKPKNIKISALN